MNGVERDRMDWNNYYSIFFKNRDKHKKVREKQIARKNYSGEKGNRERVRPYEIYKRLLYSFYSRKKIIYEKYKNQKRIAYWFAFFYCIFLFLLLIYYLDILFNFGFFFVCFLASLILSIIRLLYYNNNSYSTP